MAENLYGSLRQLDGVRMQLLRMLANDRGLSVEELLTVPCGRSADAYPLSSAQSRIFFLEKLHGPSAAYNLPAIARIEGGLDLDALRRAVEHVAERHEAFRLTFRVADGRPVQAPGPAPRMAWRHVHFEDYERDAIQREIDAEVRAPLSASEGPLLRVLAVSVAGGASHLVVTMHHIISDGPSVVILFREVGHVYACLRAGEAPRLPELPVQYLDYAVQERRLLDGRGWEEAVARLKRRYPDGLPRLRLGSDRRPGRGHIRPGAVLEFVARAPDWGSIVAASHAQGVTPFAWLLCAWIMVLRRFPWARSVPIAVPVTLRHRPELDPLVGYFSNLVLVCPAESSTSARDALEQTRVAIQDAFSAQDLPFEDLVRRLSPPRRGADSCMYDLMFQHLDFRSLKLALAVDAQSAVASPASLRSEFAVDTGTAKCALFLAVWEENGRLAGALEYDTERFDAPTVAEVRDHYLDALRRMADELSRTSKSQSPPDRRGGPTKPPIEVSHA
jgi:hypothetical protein